MTGGQLNANVDQYLQAAAMNTPPPQIVSDPLVTGVTPIEQLLRVLGLAANLSDSQDNADSANEHAERDAKTTAAAEKFLAQDEEAAQELNSVAEQTDPLATQAEAPRADQTAAMAQQLPQAVSSIAGALSGALGGALQPLAQIPQQIAQGAQQAMQTGMGLFQQAAAPVEDAGLASSPTDELGSVPEDLTGLVGDGGGELGGFGGGGDLGGADLGSGGGAGPGGAFLGGTAPTSMLGPPPVPSASTAPSSSPVSRITPPSAPPAASPASAGMAGMPMVPPGAMAGPNSSDKDAKADTRRVSVPPVRNGAPVQGRLTTPPALPPVTKKVEGAPVVTRRVVLPGNKTDNAGEDAGSDR
ncbi:MAG: hypothetical protein WCP30_07140 [Mycobacteriaceae bacterium]